MLIIVDAKIPKAAKSKLGELGELLELKTRDMTYEAISGHPDVFFCQSPDGLLVSPGLPETFYEMLTKHQVSYHKGYLPAAMKYPASSRYNAVVTNSHVIHNERCSDSSIMEMHREKIFINVKQGYTRCNLLPVSESTFITSDPGIYRVLREEGMDVLLTKTTGIHLNGMPHGFFGGTAGIHNKTIYFAGSLSKYEDGDAVRHFLGKSEFSLVELYDGPLVDVGSIIILNSFTTNDKK